MAKGADGVVGETVCSLAGAGETACSIEGETAVCGWAVVASGGIVGVVSAAATAR